METYKDYLTEIYYDSGHPAAFLVKKSYTEKLKKKDGIVFPEIK